MENVQSMSYEVVETIINSNEPTEFVVDMLRYMYNSTIDKNLKREIVDEINDLGYCIDCGKKLKLYSWEEPHTELWGNPTETMSDICCPNCDKEYIGRLRCFR